MAIGYADKHIHVEVLVKSTCAQSLNTVREQEVSIIKRLDALSIRCSQFLPPVAEFVEFTNR
jgi:hypothetical protein